MAAMVAASASQLLAQGATLVTANQPPPLRWSDQSIPAAQPPPTPPPGGPSKAFSGVLSLTDAIERGLEFNMTAVGLVNAVRGAEARERIARSTLLPNVVGTVSESAQKISLAALGVQFDVPIPGFTLPETVGPFDVFDLRARLSQTLLDRSAWNNYQASRETVRANQLSVQDARDLIVQAVGGAYLQAIAARARAESARAQVDLATTLHQRASQQRTAGLATAIDLNRAQVQTLTQQQRVLSLQAEFGKRKIDLARLIGLPPTDHYDLADEFMFSAPPVLSVEDAVRQATEQRADLQAAEAHVRAAERAVAAARAQRLPTVSVNADYGASYASPMPVQSTYAVVGTVRVPIWEGKRTSGEIQQATATLAQRRAERDDLRAQIEGEVRKAYLDLEAAASQVEVVDMNAQVNRENLRLTRARFEAGVSDNVEVVQSQSSVALVEFDYINSVLAHNLAKLGLARAVGRASEDIAQFLRLR